MNKFKMQNVELNLSDLISESTTPQEYFYWKGLNNRTIFITDDVTERMIYDVLLPLEEMDNDGTLEPIIIYLNTPGGSVYDGMAIVDTIAKLKSPTTIRVLGYALSMGAMMLTAAAGNPNVTVECTPYSIGLIHCGSETMQGTTMQVKDKAKFNEKYEKILSKLMITNLNITPEKYEEMLSREWWMTAEEMLELGLVDKIV